jgi:aldehyde dehydrogenase (NAD+)
MQEEIFGPLLPVTGFDTTEEAMAIVQKNPNPLAFYLFTDNKATENEWITKVPFGGGCINNADWHFTNHHLPFGGVGSSGLGSYHGRSSFETFTRPKSIMKTPNWFDPDLKYPPLKGKLKLFRRVIG